MLNVNLEIAFIMELELILKKFKPVIGIRRQQIMEILFQNVFLSRIIIKRLILKKTKVWKLRFIK
jgi:hypothetical protein